LLAFLALVLSVMIRKSSTSLVCSIREKLINGRSRLDDNNRIVTNEILTRAEKKALYALASSAYPKPKFSR
jgi:hypothetical protein